MPEDILNLPLIGRDAVVRADTIDEAARTIDIIWTTGATVRRARWEGWDTRVEYDEELAVNSQAIRLGRLNDGAPFLDSHATWGGVRTVLGSVVPGSVRVENGQGTAKIRLTSAPDAAPAIHRILERTINKVSVGYQVHRYEITKPEKIGEREQWRAVDWEPFEISAVAMPADPGASIRAEPSDQMQRTPCPNTSLHRGAVRFYDPANVGKRLWPCRNPEAYVGGWYAVEPKAGSMLVFEGHVPHDSTYFEGDERMCIPVLCSLTLPNSHCKAGLTEILAHQAQGGSHGL